jgi:ATP-dependent Clp protease protease subunit
MSENSSQFQFYPVDLQPAIASAMLEKIQADTRKSVAEATALEWDSRTSRIMSESADLAHTRDVERREWDSASDLENRVFHFADEVGPGSVGACIDVLSHWRRIDEGTDIKYEIVLTSPGGSVVSGYKLYSYIRQIARERHVTTVASGLCASMATIIHQAGTNRVIEEGCSYLIHDPSGVAMGTISSMDDTTAWVNALKNKSHEILAERSNLTVAEVADKASRRDWWCLPEEVLSLGFADELR